MKKKNKIFLLLKKNRIFFQLMKIMLRNTINNNTIIQSWKIIIIYILCEIEFQYGLKNNQTLSVLNFVPSINDDGKYLTCRAENPVIPDSAIEDKWFLDVHYPPVVTLRMGEPLISKDIKEGDDVYFECSVKANPKAYKLSWYKDVSFNIYHLIIPPYLIINNVINIPVISTLLFKFSHYTPPLQCKSNSFGKESISKKIISKIRIILVKNNFELKLF